MKRTCPNYLKKHETLWETDPHAANLAWWKEAKFGMFLHYGLYSFISKKEFGQPARPNEWAQFTQCIPIKDYKSIQNVFTAHNFDAEFITDLAIESGMSYINLVTCHHDSFCLWDSKVEPFNSMNAPSKRNLVKELADACDRKGLGFFTYYTFAQNWMHPYFVDNTVVESARPHYAERPEEYLYEKPEDFKIYIDYMMKCMEELLLDCGTTAGIWLDLIMAFYPLRDHGYFNIEEIYAKLREIRPDALLSWKQGATGTEDFATPEQHFHSLEKRMRESFGDAAAEHHKRIWEINCTKHNEICATLQPDSWGFSCFSDHHSADYCYELLGHASMHDANLLLNIGPLPDGSISPIQVDILKKLGAIIREKGYPSKGDIYALNTGLPE